MAEERGARRGGGGVDNTCSQLLLHCHISAIFHLMALFFACQQKGQTKGFKEREGRGFLKWAWERRVDRRGSGGGGGLVVVGGRTQKDKDTI